ncbi:MAG: 50S ribosomal protein L39e [Candidatus Micrarchaeota archaeon]
MSKKTSKKKSMLGKKNRQNKRMPIFVVAKTKRKVVSSNRRRDWRSRKLKIKEE